MTTQEVADWLRITRFSIYRYIRHGLPHYRLGAQHRFKRREVEMWMKACADGTIDETPALHHTHRNAHPRTQTHTMSLEETTAKLKELMG